MTSFLALLWKSLFPECTYRNWTGCWASHSWWCWSGRGQRPSYHSPWSRTTAGAACHSHQHWPVSHTQTCKGRSKTSGLKAFKRTSNNEKSTAQVLDDRSKTQHLSWLVSYSYHPCLTILDTGSRNLRRGKQYPGIKRASYTIRAHLFIKQ